MFNNLLKKLALAIFPVIFMVSCEAENEVIELAANPDVESAGPYINSRAGLFQKRDLISELNRIPVLENLQPLVLNPNVAPSECRTTAFSEVRGRHFAAIIEDSLAMANLNWYISLNRYASLLNLEEEYFGVKGEYTGLVQKLQKDLERFWNMPDEIKVHGQHLETLNNRDKLIDLFWYLIADLESKEDVYPIVDELLYFNSLSPNLPESPFFASDGLATYHDHIIIGDGLIQMFAETGIDESIVWTGILSHEWSHQVQINNLSSWYPADGFSSQSERSRLMELEADFFSAYYMTHKKGGTLNWKRVQGFFTLFFQSGDCGFELPSHHGTPLQREKAALAGYELAAQADKKGHVLEPQEVHDAFRNQLPNICASCP